MQNNNVNTLSSVIKYIFEITIKSCFQSCGFTVFVCGGFLGCDPFIACVDGDSLLRNALNYYVDSINSYKAHYQSLLNITSHTHTIYQVCSTIELTCFHHSE